MDVHVTRSTLRGTARAPPSKSYTHRALLAAGYSDGATVESPLVSADTRATARAVTAFGGAVAPAGVDGGTEADPALADADALAVEGFGGRPAVPDDVIDCANSGTTMRLVTAAAALADGATVLTGDGSLRSRPQGPLLDALGDLGVRAESTRSNGQAPLVVAGPLAGGEVAIPGDVSSQYVTALLMAGAVTDEGVEVDLTTDLKSAPYVDITLELLADFGVEATPVDADGDPLDGAAGAAGFSVPGGQTYAPSDGTYAVPGDFSSISYLLGAGAVAADPGEAVRIEGARPSAQGDAAIVGIVEEMGAAVDWDREAGEIAVERADLAGVTVDVGDTPDLLPTIAALGAVADGDTRIENCEHVRYKETDRVSAMAEELEKMGAETAEEPDVLTVHGSESDLRGATVDGRGDHRIVMALSVAALAAEGTTTVRGAEHVDVSFPAFFDAMADLGMDVERDGAVE
ncbi:3-phosphoshikimate 1-carboxyvinyltransferase [Halorubrum sp. Atlit-8R]|uniref:3-phosphoshikimate 1-carboxyvinyltransferase n=1 Tax=unclassified Halorubrum TaxID=2642239 RepID=UPI000EF2339C|nr:MULTISPECIES: 3-phosphoshikimate 1-carboxyvinyltransferase [unclassified Halorubrum]RLM71188.1 3-phosphoshikimate 1-carboxyvinyltransferase [Halorubrum sp. Atlit-9R]RLM72056.1 3-phosphoshikimate 1-carboxyvinyltransferase [Halorubrum sp. Atlit-9R]RLM82660.1 3-phosphoshikimate 1-carboxyvinyltransferase [Halorubrum sp. Atlit-8R]